MIIAVLIIMLMGEDEAYFIVDKRVIDQVEVIDIPCALMAAFFVYNICYPKGCANLYTFLEITVFIIIIIILRRKHLHL